MSIRQNIQSIQQQIQSITDRPVMLVAVTKNRTIDEVQQAIVAGVTHVGENRLQEAQQKMGGLEGITKHFIGRLQTNKVAEVVPLFDVIQSVDSLRLAQRIDRECKKINKIMPVLIQVNSSEEPQKGGLAFNEVIGFIERIKNFENLKMKGLMTMAMQSDHREAIRDCFRKTKLLFDCIHQKAISGVEMTYLSMGMSSDYLLAIEEGANMVRIGGKLFD